MVNVMADNADAHQRVTHHNDFTHLHCAGFLCGRSQLRGFERFESGTHLFVGLNVEGVS